MSYRCALLLSLSSALLLAAALACAAPPHPDLAALQAKVPAFKVIPLPATGEVTLSRDQAFTVDLIRGVKLDDNPPVGAPPDQPYDPRMTDDLLPGKTPAYIAEGIEPFRLNRFNCEFNYGGWHNYAMHDYAITHGFNFQSNYNTYRQVQTHIPAGSKWLTWGGFEDWGKWMTRHNVPAGRYDLLADLDVAQIIFDEGYLKDSDPAQWDAIMIDMEHGCLPLEALRQQEWYPKDETDAAKQAFEKKYYHGFALTYVGPVQAARMRGFKNISVYGWQPFNRQYFGLDKATVGGPDDWRWNLYGKEIYDAVDIINNSVYCFYWAPDNVAYTLANIDLNMKLINAQPVKKPVRPYYWTLFHGGGGGQRWWANQVQTTEDLRAQIAMCFFSGCDGFDTWNWSGTGSHQAPPPPAANVDYILADEFEAPLENAPEGAQPRLFKRYDAVRVVSVDDAGVAHFQFIDKAKPDTTLGAGKPTYLLPAGELRLHARANAEGVAATVEAMALVKPFENLLRDGEVKIDVSSQLQFAQKLPLVRRVKNGNLHLLVTYDPLVVHGGQPRSIVLKDFDGKAGLTLTLPADSETRLFVLQEG